MSEDGLLRVEVTAPPPMASGQRMTTEVSFCSAKRAPIIRAGWTNWAKYRFRVVFKSLEKVFWAPFLILGNFFKCWASFFNLLPFGRYLLTFGRFYICSNLITLKITRVTSTRCHSKEKRSTFEPNRLASGLKIIWLCLNKDERILLRSLKLELHLGLSVLR